MLEFAPTLLPIAAAYHIAHYYTLLVIQGQDIVHLISDPFGFGWNIFGTANFKPNIALIDTKFIWNSQVIIIVLGHIIAVYLAHIRSIQLFKSDRKAILSQIPMLILMVFYTVVGLWILSLPFGNPQIEDTPTPADTTLIRQPPPPILP